MHNIAHHQPSADATGDPHLHCTAFEREFAELERQFIRTAATKYLGGPDDSRVLNQARYRFRLLIAVAMASVDSGTVSRCTLETVAELTDGQQKCHDPARLALDVIELFTAKLAGAAERMTR